MRLLVINSNNILPRTVSELSQLILFKFLTLRFLSPPPRELIGTTYDVHPGLIPGVMNFLLVLIELFCARCYRVRPTAETNFGLNAMSENISKIGDFAPRGQFDPKFQVERGRPHQSFLHC